LDFAHWQMQLFATATDCVNSGISREEWLAGYRQVYDLVASKKQM
jgi:hypothetical protein